MQAIVPPVNGCADQSRLIAEHFFNRMIPAKLIGAEIPVPQHIVRGAIDQAIVLLAAPQRLFSLLALGDVLDHAKHAMRLIGTGIKRQRAMRLNPVNAAVGPNDPAIKVPFVSARNGISKSALHGLTIVRMHVTDERVVRPVLKWLGRSKAPIMAERRTRFAGDEVQFPIAQAARLHRDLQSLPALTHCSFRSPPLGHIAKDQHATDRLTVGKPDRRS